MKSKKVLALALAATMMFASAFTVSAASGGSAGSVDVTVPSGSAGSAGSVDVTVPGGLLGGSSESAAAESSGGSSESATESFVTTPSAGSRVTVGGRAIQTTVGGVFAAKSVAGVAVITPVADLRASLGLSGSQTPHIVVFDTDAKKSNLAMNCVNAAAGTLGGTVVSTLNVELRAKENGKFVALSNGSAGLVIGLPKNADTSKTYSVICVQPGGVVTILQDQDDSPATVTFEVKAGLGTYGIVAR